jgi:hypothetical protein
MYFKLNSKCTQVQQGNPLRIFALQVQQAKAPVVSLGLAFQYNAEQKQFGIYQRALLQAKVETTDSLVAHCAMNEEVEFIIESNKIARRLTGLLRFKNGTERRFAIGYTLPSGASANLSTFGPEQSSSGAKATVYKGIRGKFIIPLFEQDSPSKKADTATSE